MNLTLLIILGVLSVVLLAALVLFSRSVFARVIIAMFAFGFSAFCAFGFLASFEPLDTPNWPWQLGYATLCIGSIIAGLLALKSACSGKQPSTSTH